MRRFRKVADNPVSKATRLTIYVVSNVSAVQRLFAGKSGGMIAGFYLPRSTGSLAFVPRSSNFTLDPEVVLRHEYAHHFMYNNYPASYPSWFSEGFAEFHSTAKFGRDGSVGLGTPAQHRAYELGAYERAMSAEDLLTYAGAELDADERLALYGRGWLMVHYLTFEPSRAGQLKAYFEQFLAGKSVAEAATVFGDLKQLDRDLRSYLRRSSMTYYKLEASELPKEEIAIRQLGAGEEAVMELKMRSRRGVDREQALALLPDMRKAAAPYGSDPAVQATLAEAEYDAGHYQEAQAAADRALAAAPAHVDALIYKGLARLAQIEDSTDPMDWREARSWLIKANRADPEDAEPMVRIYRSYMQQGLEPSESIKNGLLYAYQLAPEDMDLRMQVAHLLLRDGKPDSAKVALAPIANNPHGGATAKVAAEILEFLKAGDQEAALKTIERGPAPEEGEGDEGGTQDTPALRR